MEETQIQRYNWSLQGRGVMWWVVVSLVLSWSSQTSAVSVSCKDEKNRDVDWYILYKAPNNKPLTGLEYIYIDSHGKRPLNDINITNGVLANTLRPMLTNNIPPGLGFLSYNDQPPKASNIYGHSKGVVVGDRGTQSALWLTHSTPQFPFARNPNNFWPKSGNRNGQTFMCVTLELSQLKLVGMHLQYIRANPFDHKIPSGFPTEMIDAANGVHSPPPGVFKDLETKGKVNLKLWAKDSKTDASDGDLYVALTRGFHSDMNAQTWGCQRGRDQSYCVTNFPKVMNVEMININNLGKWSTKRDHSKWAVTTAKDITWTCFGDVNRSPSQYQRWGGAMCIKDKTVNCLFKGFVDSTLQCRKRPQPCSSDEILSDLDSELDSELDTGLDSSLDSEMDSELDSGLDSDLDSEIESLAESFKEKLEL